MKQEIKDFFESVQMHKKLVLEAGVIVGGISDEQLFNHDASKFTIEEFPHYARQFHGDKGDSSGFEKAWEHHWRNNNHHWQYWLSNEGEPFLMPEECVREMVADWAAASFQYTGSWNMTEWLNKNFCLPEPKIKLHSKSADILHDVLHEIGYVLENKNCQYLHVVLYKKGYR